MSRTARFLHWARRLDQYVLGPGGLLPDGMDYWEYQRANMLAPYSPMWVRLGRPFGLVVLLAVGTSDSNWALGAFLVIFVTFMLLVLRADRDTRLAARRRSLPHDDK